MYKERNLAGIAVWLVWCVLFISACATRLQSPTQPVPPQATPERDSTFEGGTPVTGQMQAPSPTVPSIQTQVPATPTESMMQQSKPVQKIDKSQFRQAPPLYSSTWINSPPLTLDRLRGHVVIVSFWTFACYNCQNTLPYFRAWDQKFRDRGLVIIGVHTPELSFERDVANVRQAVKDDDLRYPIAIDGDYANWNRYGVQAWPTWFILDKEGYIRYRHVGEGDYAGTEKTIAALLQE